MEFEGGGDSTYIVKLNAQKLTTHNNKKGYYP